jgi:hypothetical protein
MVTRLTARIGKVVARPAAKETASGRKVKLPYSPATSPSVNRKWANKPPSTSAEVKRGFLHENPIVELLLFLPPLQGIRKTEGQASLQPFRDIAYRAGLLSSPCPIEGP